VLLRAWVCGCVGVGGFVWVGGWVCVRGAGFMNAIRVGSREEVLQGGGAHTNSKRRSSRSKDIDTRAAAAAPPTGPRPPGAAAAHRVGDRLQRQDGEGLLDGHPDLLNAWGWVIMR